MLPSAIKQKSATVRADGIRNIRTSPGPNVGSNFGRRSCLKKLLWASRRQFMQKGSLGLLSSLVLPLPALANPTSDFAGLVVNEDEGEAIQMRDGTAIVKIKIAKVQGSESISFLSESFRPGDALLVRTE